MAYSREAKRRLLQFYFQSACVRYLSNALTSRVEVLVLAFEMKEESIQI